jgi:hypothetical protein
LASLTFWTVGEGFCCMYLGVRTSHKMFGKRGSRWGVYNGGIVGKVRGLGVSLP